MFIYPTSIDCYRHYLSKRRMGTSKDSEFSNQSRRNLEDFDYVDSEDYYAYFNVEPNVCTLHLIIVNDWY